jgi:four helix bundle protein
MKNFRTYELAKRFYKDCQKLKLKAPFKDQFDRAILSVILNLVEGSAKPTAKDRRRFYSISMGSLREVQAILDLCGYTELLQLSDSVAACLHCLIQRPGGSP